MGERLKEIFLQRGHTDDQDAHEKMLSVANHQSENIISHFQEWLS